MTNRHEPEMPLDPFADDGVDEMAVELAERLAHEGAAPNDPRWERIGAEPTIDDFDDAADELDEFEELRDEEWAAWSAAQTGRNAMVRAIAVLLALGLLGMYVLTLFR